MAQISKEEPPHPSFIAHQIREHRYFFLNLKPSPKDKLTVTCGGWENCAPNYQINRRDFAFYGLEYVAKGRGILTLKGIETPLVPGAVFAYAPFTQHAIRTGEEDPLVKYFIDFSGTEAKRIIGRQVLGSNGIAYLHQSRHVHDLYENILDAGLQGGRMAPRICSTLLELLALRLEEDSHGASELHSRARQTFERSRLELSQHFRVIHSVSELAQRLHLDSAYLSRLFDRFLAESPHEMLTRLKVNEAAALLIGGRHTVKEVAAQVGFADPYHFSRVFKKLHGVSPINFNVGRMTNKG